MFSALVVNDGDDGDGWGERREIAEWAEAEDYMWMLKNMTDPVERPWQAEAL